MNDEIKKDLKFIEDALIKPGRKIISKPVMFKDDHQDIKNLEKALTHIEIMIKRENRRRHDEKRREAKRFK